MLYVSFCTSFRHSVLMYDIATTGRPGSSCVRRDTGRTGLVHECCSSHKWETCTLNHVVTPGNRLFAGARATPIAPVNDLALQGALSQAVHSALEWAAVVLRSSFGDVFSTAVSRRHTQSSSTHPGPNTTCSHSSRWRTVKHSAL